MPDDLYQRFASQPDMRQTQMYATVMEGIGWSTYGKPGSQIFVRKLGPVAVAKMQRSSIVDHEFLFSIRKKYHVLLTQIEPALTIHNSKEKIVFPYTFDPKADISTWRSAVKKVGLTKTFPPLAHSATSIIDLLPSEEKMLAGVKIGTRYNIKLAYRKGLLVKTIPLREFTKKDTSNFFSILAEWSSRKHVYGFDPTLMRSVMKGFRDEGWCHFGYLHDNLETVALMLKNGKQAFYYCGVSSKMGYKNRIPTALVWEGMKKAKSLGCEIFDFGGIADPRYPGEYKKWLGFTTFKEGFSPTPLLYPPSFRTSFGWWSER